MANDRNNAAARITAPTGPALEELCEKLAGMADATGLSNEWPEEQLRLCGEAGVFEWFLADEWGGQDWSDADVVRGYLALAEACLTTTFVITQRTGACRRIAAGENNPLKARLLPPLAAGDTFATVGISHLTTSHRHVKTPILRATRAGDGWRLDGFAPWVSGATHADHILTGATVMDGDAPTTDQILVVVPGDAEGVRPGEPTELVGLTASHTGRVEFDAVAVDESRLVAGPMEKVMLGGHSSRPGGHETSTLALGLASAAIKFLAREAEKRDELLAAHQSLAAEHAEVTGDLLAIASGTTVCTNESLRQRANSLVLRSTQAALAAAKGAGYVAGHPAGRWCREALFFLVWSCPQPVMNANLCELAGLSDEA